MRKTAAAVLIALSACAPRPADEAAPPPPAEETAPPSGPVLPFIADDYPAALAEAQERDLPIFVESWAPW
jgi:hypothetical protein